MGLQGPCERQSDWRSCLVIAYIQEDCWLGQRALFFGDMKMRKSSGSKKILEEPSTHEPGEGKEEASKPTSESEKEI